MVLWPVVVVDSSTEARRGFRTVLLLNKGQRIHTVQRVPPGAIVGLMLISIPVLRQWLRFISDPFMHLTTLEEAEIIPGKHSDTRIKPLIFDQRPRPLF